MRDSSASQLVGPVAAALVFLVLAVAHTWPLAFPPWRQSMTYHGDVQLNSWIVGWIAHALVTDPARLFDGNIFWPETGTIAYSDPLIVPALIVAPVIWLGGSAVLAFNVTDIAGLVLTAWATWFVVRQWTGSGSAALVSGALAAFNVHTLTRLAHLAATHAWGLPLAWYFADRLLGRPRWSTAVLLALVVAATAATSLYLLAFVGVIVSVVVLTGLRSWPGAAAVAGASLAGLLLAVPVFLPYLRLSRTGASRPIEMVQQFSATLAGYVSSTSHVHAGWSSRFGATDVNLFFAGITAIALAVVGIAAAVADDRAARRRVLALLVVAAAGVFLSLGPATDLYRWLYSTMTPLHGLRAAARFGYVFLVAIAIAAGFGVSRLERRFSPRGRLLATVALLALVTVEAWSAPVRSTEFRGVPPIYRHVADAPDPVRLVEVPFYPPEIVHDNGEYVLNATAHWKPLMNGYSGFTPASYRERAAAFWFFPEAWAIDAIKRDGATHLVVHLEKFTPAEAITITETLNGRADFRLVASDTQGHRLYVIRAD